MISAPHVLAAAKSGQHPPTWHVVRADKGHFIREAIGSGFFLLLVLGFLVWFNLQDEFVVVLRILAFLEAISDQTWKIIDNVVLIFIACCIIYALYRAIRNLAALERHCVVIMPEGVVIDLAEKEPIVLDFAAIPPQGLQVIQDQNANANLRVIDAYSGQERQYELDQRFGKPGPLFEQILQRHQMFHQANQVPGNQPLYPGGVQA
uniref:Uncharacterized protein n=1 Tax=Thermosporothrix sp. COM3 TaxID=2490863 RepID=A0A455SGV6_9CHLR|nr:hypothetical protein KTC_09830 [Thermosporothrix sp. COM3]